MTPIKKRVKPKGRSRKKTRNKPRKDDLKVSKLKIPAKFAKFLLAGKAKYELVEHRTVYTTFDTAMTLKVAPKIVAKTLLIKADRNLIMVVIAGNKNLDFTKLKKAINGNLKKEGLKTVKKISLASEKTIEKKFTHSPGALPPFGKLYGIDTYIDKGLIRNDKIILNTGLFKASLAIKAKEYVRLADGILGSFSKTR